MSPPHQRPSSVSSPPHLRQGSRQDGGSRPWPGQAPARRSKRIVAQLALHDRARPKYVGEKMNQRFAEGTALRPLPRSTRSSMRSESTSPTLSATTSETRSPAPHGSGLRPARGHVWMAPGSQGEFRVLEPKVACGHVSGLLARR